jgi:hypothetical protein
VLRITARADLTDNEMTLIEEVLRAVLAQTAHRNNEER